MKLSHQGLAIPRLHGYETARQPGRGPGEKGELDQDVAVRDSNPKSIVIRSYSGRIARTTRVSQRLTHTHEGKKSEASQEIDCRQFHWPAPI
jgi:hypothetical protein